MFENLKFGHRAVSLVSDIEPLLIEERGVGECGGFGEAGTSLDD